jgi:hypothetical protein
MMPISKFVRFKSYPSANLKFEVFGSHSLGRREAIGQVTRTIEAMISDGGNDGGQLSIPVSRIKLNEGTLAIEMNIPHMAGTIEGTLKFKIERIVDGAIEDMKEAFAAATHGMHQRQHEDASTSARIGTATVRQVANFETRWRPVLDQLELLKKAGDHISEVSHFFCLHGSLSQHA